MSKEHAKDARDTHGDSNSSTVWYENEWMASVVTAMLIMLCLLLVREILSWFLKTNRLWIQVERNTRLLEHLVKITE